MRHWFPRFWKCLRRQSYYGPTSKRKTMLCQTRLLNQISFRNYLLFWILISVKCVLILLQFEWLQLPRYLMTRPRFMRVRHRLSQLCSESTVGRGQSKSTVWDSVTRDSARVIQIGEIRRSIIVAYFQQPFSFAYRRTS